MRRALVCIWLVSSGLVASALPAYAAHGRRPVVSFTRTLGGSEGETVVAHLVLTYAPRQRHPVSVHVATRDGSARAGSDYEAINTDVTFVAGGPRDVALPIRLLSDDVIESGEWFAVRLSTPRNVILRGDHADVWIGDVGPRASCSTNSDFGAVQWSFPDLTPAGATGYTLTIFGSKAHYTITIDRDAGTVAGSTRSYWQAWVFNPSVDWGPPVHATVTPLGINQAPYNIERCPDNGTI